MSLLEDIFLQDEANEARELERVIEGDEFDERPRSISPSSEESDGGRREDEAEEDKRRVDPASTKTKRVTKNPRFILNPARLTGPRGIQVIPDHFKDFKFKGKGHEKEDLDLVLKRLEHWAYRLYPKFQFQDCLKKIETLGKKRPVMVHLHKIRTDQFMSEETVVQKDSSDDENQPPQEEDEFDKLLQQQIEIARATPAPGSVKKVVDKGDQWARVIETPNRDKSLLPMPKATSSPSISDEQKERMLRNRRLAEERRLARLKQSTSIDNNTTNTIIEVDENEPVKDKPNEINDASTVIEINDEVIPKKSNKSQVLDSSDSDDDCGVTAVNESIVVDVHNGSSSNIGKGKDHDETTHKIGDDDAKEIDEKGNDIEEMVVDEDHSAKDIEDNNDIDETTTGDVVENVQGSAKSNDDELYSVDVIEKNVDDNVIDKDNNDNVDKIVVEEENYENLNNKDVDTEINDVPEDSNKVLDENNEVTKETAVSSPKAAVRDETQAKDVAGEFSDDIMDVDFSDDF